MSNPYERFKTYRGLKCWQAYVSDVNLKGDLRHLFKKYPMLQYDLDKLRTSDFEFGYIPKEDKEGCSEVRTFIERHEWLGKMPNRPTHRFVARLYGEELAGVVVMATPNTFSHLLGKEYRHAEKLIARGASISWAPKNLASWMISRSMKHMVEMTGFRIFTAYSDPEAKELGTIYQALNFNYLGQSAGTNKLYFDPQNPQYGWFSSRNFRHKSKYARYAKEIGMPNLWKDNPEYMGKYSPNWDKIPPKIGAAIKERGKIYQASCIERLSPTKHKYAYILGKGPSETKKLRKRFRELNPQLADLLYPKYRGK